MIAALLIFGVTLGLLGGLARFGRIYPHRPLVWLLIVPAALSFVVFFVPTWAWVVGGIDLLLVVVAAIDLASLPRRKVFSVERQTGRIASLAKAHVVHLTITHRGRRARWVWIRDRVPVEMEALPDHFVLLCEPASRMTVDYQLRSSRRGAFELAETHLRVRSRWTLWQRFYVYPAVSTVHVYPDMQQLSQYAILARTNRLNLMGVRRTRRIGQDNEFERLRDYTRDDNVKHIAWASTARRNRLTVKDYQANQSQRLIFMLDCGRMMVNQAAGISLLDHALNAMLMLSYVALKQGDSVGLMCFADGVQGFVPARGGLGQMNRLLHASFDRFPKLVESRYDEAFLYLATRARKRSLVVLITSVIDEVNANQIEQYLSSLVGQHLPLGVLLRDRQLFDAADYEPPYNEQRLFEAAAAADILSWRHQVLRDLQSRGVLSLDVFPEDLTAPLINSYLNIKARRLL